MKNYYAILNLEYNATDEQVRKQYRKLAMQYHPDHNPGDTRAEEQFKEIVDAYAVLGNLRQRKKYDTKRRGDRRTSAKQNHRHHAKRTQRRGARVVHHLALFAVVLFSRYVVQLIQKMRQTPLRTAYNSKREKKSAPSFTSNTRRGSKTGFAARTSGNKRVLLQTFHGVYRLGKMAQDGVKRVQASTQKALHNRLYCSRKEEKGGELDIVYYTPLRARELQEGKMLTIHTIDANGSETTFRIHIPKGSRSGQKLRIKGKGHKSDLDRRQGDLYLHLEEE